MATLDPTLLCADLAIYRQNKTNPESGRQKMLAISSLRLAILAEMSAIVIEVLAILSEMLAILTQLMFCHNCQLF